ncbi:MAG: 3-keto-disaccharide hydrolase [Chitinophagaceae bacterium]
MKKENLIKTLFIAGSLQLIIVYTAAAQWKSLFNGKDLKGWNQKNGAAKYKVENGEIVGTTVANTSNSFLCTNEEYSDFIFEVDLKVEDAMNSGVQFRSLSKPDFQNSRVHGYQMEVDPTDRAWSGGIYDEARRDWLYIPNINPEGKKAFKKGDWNKYRIEAIGNTLRTWINGVPVSHLIDDMTAKGFIALQVHAIYADMKEGMKIRWRNIRIQTVNLKPTAFDNTPVINLLLNNISDQEKKQGVQLLFNGKDFAGWRAVHGDKMPATHWSIQNGEINVSPSAGSETGNDIVTTELYAAFELTFDFKLSEGANSGVKYFVNEAFDSEGKSGIGLEYQVLDDEKHPDAKMGAAGNRTLASLYDLIPSYKLDKRFQRKIGEWNQGRIIVYPNNIVQHWLNGFKVVEYERKSNIFDALVARSKYEKYKGFGAGDKGNILLQDHGNNVSFRNLKIREL